MKLRHLMTFSQICIYTIAQRTKLAEAASRPMPAAFSETKPWVMGFRLWRQAKDNDIEMPIVFGDAVDCSKLIYWGILKDVIIDGKSTNYSVDRLQRVRGCRRPQDLRLRSTGAQIAAHFIRPYAICQTPEFLRVEEQRQVPSLLRDIG
jgi:hypothetical protein